MQTSEEAISREMEELCGKISKAANAAAEDRAASEKEIAELQSLLHAARAETAQVRFLLRRTPDVVSNIMLSFHAFAQ
jgi:hypothetical protein